MKAVENTPGKLFLGKVPVRKVLRRPEGQKYVKKVFREQIEKKFAQKWGLEINKSF